MAEIRKKLGALLIEAGLVDEYQLKSGLAQQKQWGGRLGHNLVKLGFLSEESLLKFLSKQLSLPCVDFGKVRIIPSVLKIVPDAMVKKYNIMPLAIKETEKGRKTLFLAMSDPTHLDAIDEIQFTTGLAVKPVIATESSLADAIMYYYDGMGQHPSEKAKNLPARGDGTVTADKVKEKEEEFVVMSDGPDQINMAMEALKTEGLSKQVPESKEPVIVLEDDGDRQPETEPQDLTMALANLLIEKGFITREELALKLRKNRKHH